MAQKEEFSKQLKISIMQSNNLKSRGMKSKLVIANNQSQASKCNYGRSEFDHVFFNIAKNHVQFFMNSKPSKFLSRIYV